MKHSRPTENHTRLTDRIGSSRLKFALYPTPSLALLAVSLCCPTFAHAGIVNAWLGNHSGLSAQSSTVGQSRPAPAARETSYDSALAAQLQEKPRSQSPSVAQPPLTFVEKVERVGLVVLSILACLHFGPRAYRRWKSRPDAWAEVTSQAVDVSSEAVGEQLSFSRFVSTLQTDPAASGPDTAAAVKQYFADAPSQIAAMRKTFSEVNEATEEDSRKTRLAQLYRELQSFKNLAGLPVLYSAWELTSALEGLFKQLTDKPANVTPSTLHTAESALILLEELSRPEVKPDLSRTPPVRLLAVDDDPISRVAVSSSLKKVFKQPDVAADGQSGLILAENNAYDLIFLDIEMPGMDGYELCSKIHETKNNAATPVIFVTRHSDFDARAKSARSGGQDLIGKPFLSFEITVKALTFVLRRRLQPPAPATPQGETKHNSNQPSGQSASESTTSKQKEIETIEGRESAAPSGPTTLPASMVATTNRTVSEVLAAKPVEVRRDQAPAFFAQAPTHIEAIRHQLQAFTYAGNEHGGTDIFRNVNVSMLWLAAEAERAGLHAVSRLSSTLQGLVKKLLENRKHATPSAIASANAAVELLDELCVGARNPDLANPPIRILVVDDDPIARRAMSGAIQLAFSKPDSADTGEEALAMAREKTFDVIFLDIQMPGMDGFVACSKIHETALNAHTPVVFVTTHSDTKSRERASASGGCGFIPKPVLAIEITLQALTLALRGRLQRTAPAPIPEEAATVC